MAHPNHTPTVTVVDPLDADGHCVVHEPATSRTYRVVDCADPLVEAKLGRKRPGETTRLELTPADPDGLDWIATRLEHGRVPVPEAGG